MKFMVPIAMVGLLAAAPAAAKDQGFGMVMPNLAPDDLEKFLALQGQANDLINLFICVVQRGMTDGPGVVAKFQAPMVERVNRLGQTGFPLMDSYEWGKDPSVTHEGYRAVLWTMMGATAGIQAAQAVQAGKNICPPGL